MIAIGRIIAAIALGSISLGACGFLVRVAATDAALVDGRLQMVVRIPKDQLPRGTVQEVPGRPMTRSDRDDLRAAVRRNPLEQELVNLAYVDTVEGGAPDKVIAERAALLGRLGWRYTPAQQNLMLHEGAAGDLHTLLDRGDALLRRRTLLAPGNQMMAVLEATPGMSAMFVQRLASKPGWRSDYLVASSQAATPEFLDIRARTMSALLDARSPVERREIAPLLSGLIASGRGHTALALWMRYSGVRASGSSNVLQDPMFREVRGRSIEQGALPFEWRLGSDLGYSAATSPDRSGIELSWDGKGTPVFMAQWVPIVAGSQYRLVVRGQTDGKDLGAILRPLLQCGDRQLVFDAVASNPTSATFRSEHVPDGCDMAELSLNGQLGDGTSTMTATITSLALTPL